MAPGFRGFCPWPAGSIVGGCGEGVYHGRRMCEELPQGSQEAVSSIPVHVGFFLVPLLFFLLFNGKEGKKGGREGGRKEGKKARKTKAKKKSIEIDATKKQKNYKAQQNQIWFFGKINKIDKPLAKLTKTQLSGMNEGI
jgi:hypothetical protein